MAGPSHHLHTCTFNNQTHRCACGLDWNVNALLDREPWVQSNRRGQTFYVDLREHGSALTYLCMTVERNHGRKRRAFNPSTYLEDAPRAVINADGYLTGGTPQKPSEPRSWIDLAEPEKADFLRGGGWKRVGGTGAPAGRPRKGMTNTKMIAAEVHPYLNGYTLGEMPRELRRIMVRELCGRRVRPVNKQALADYLGVDRATIKRDMKLRQNTP